MGTTARNIVFFLSAAALTAGCANHGVNSTSENVVTDSVAGGVPAMDGAANMGNTQAGAISSHWSFIPNAQATVSCGEFAVQDACAAGVQAANYLNCSNWGGSLNGQVILTYSSATCAFSASGETITRTVNLTRTGLFGGTVTTDSKDPTVAWNGSPVGTGAELTYTGANAYTLSIGGSHKTRVDATGNPVYDISVFTTVPMTMTGTLNGTRTVTGGSVTILHNTAKYKAVFVPNNLQYSSATCCHPVGGTITATYTGSVSTTGTVTFGSTCGLATVSNASGTQTVQLQGCE
jgi:hypothetical protein